MPGVQSSTFAIFSFLLFAHQQSRSGYVTVVKSRTDSGRVVDTSVKDKGFLGCRMCTGFIAGAHATRLNLAIVPLGLLRMLGIVYIDNWYYYNSPTRQEDDKTSLL
jgi:hypothetical protein